MSSAWDSSPPTSAPTASSGKGLVAGGGHAGGKGDEQHCRRRQAKGQYRLEFFFRFMMRSHWQTAPLYDDRQEKESRADQRPSVLGRRRLAAGADQDPAW